jgi:predicted component of type VI protein secretion system
MEIERHETVTCAIQLLRDDARIWWGVVAQLRDVKTMSWTEFLKIFSERYSGGEVGRTVQIDEGFKLGGSPND